MLFFKKIKKQGLFLMLIILLLCLGGCNFENAATKYSPWTCARKELCLPDTSCISVRMAQNDYQRQRGLMYDESLPENEGMLFVFETESNYSFWMENMSFPLDIIWLDKNYHIVYMTEAEPCLEDVCKRYVPLAPAMYVLEVNRGFALKHNLHIGDQFILK